VSAGPAVIAAGLALFTRIGPPGNYVTEVLPAVTASAWPSPWRR
jgi:hypothetical protein